MTDYDELVSQGALYKSQRDECLVTIADQSEYLFEADKLKDELVKALEDAIWCAVRYRDDNRDEVPIVAECRLEHARQLLTRAKGEDK